MSDSPTVLSALDEVFAEMVDDPPATGTDEPETAEPEPAEHDTEGSEADPDVTSEDVPAEEEPPADEGDDAGEVGAGEEIVELAEGQTIRLPDGTEVPVEKAALFQADYTRKTQALAEQRREFEAEKEQVEQLKSQVDETFTMMRDWYEPRAANPSGWAAEIVSGTDDPTRTVAKVLYDLAQARRPDGTPVLRPEFVEMFGLEQGEVAQAAQQVSRDDELAELRARVEQQERERAEQQELRQRAAQYQQEWDSIKLANGLEFSDPNVEREAKRELLTFIRQTGIDSSLTDAYDLMQARRARQTPPSPAPKPAPVPATKARASQAVTPRSAASAPSASAGGGEMSVRNTLLDVLSDMPFGD